MRRHLLVLSLFAAIAPIGAQSTVAPSDSAAPIGAPRKSVAVARVLAIVPGVGHAYAGEGGRGLAFVGGLLGVTALTGVILAGSCVADALDTSSDSVCEGNAMEDLGALAVLGVWGWSIYDAGAAARRTNVRQARVARLAHVPLTLGVARRPTASGHDARALKVGMRFTVR
jgi:hypothetical protein